MNVTCRLCGRLISREEGEGIQWTVCSRQDKLCHKYIPRFAERDNWGGDGSYATSSKAVEKCLSTRYIWGPFGMRAYPNYDGGLVLENSGGDCFEIKPDGASFVLDILANR